MAEKIEIEYVGNHHPKGIYEVPKNKADILLESGQYQMPGKSIKSTAKKVVTEKPKFDLDGDGDFDKDDVSIAAKAMAAGKKLKKNDG